MTEDGAVPKFEFDASSETKEQGYEAWREVVRGACDVYPLSENAGRSERLSAWLVDEMIFTEVSHSAQWFRRDKNLAQDTNLLYFEIARKGGATGLFAGEEFVQRPGQIHFSDYSREMYSRSDESSIFGVSIPHNLIDYDPGIHPAAICYATDSPVGRFLENSFFSLFDQLDSVDYDNAVTMGRAFRGMLKELMLPAKQADPDRRMRRKDRLDEIRSYIDRKLAEPKLDAEHLCQAFNISRPSLYRLFADVGGVANYITQRRVERAFFKLTLRPASAGYVKEVANGVGFSDAGHFSRLFRKRFGITPTEAALAQQGGTVAHAQGYHGQTSEGLGQLMDWVRAG